METLTLFKGLALGFVLAMSVGPIALLCISTTLGKGPKHGLAVGLGAATADGIYGLAAALGLSLLVTFMADYSIWLKIIGGLFLLYLGWKIMTSAFEEKKSRETPGALLATYVAVLGLTLINPVTIATFMGAFAGMGVGDTGGDLKLSLILGLGIWIGSAGWHSVLVILSYTLKHRVKTHHLLRLNKVSGVIIGGFGLIALASTSF